jgi:predicted permease
VAPDLTPDWHVALFVLALAIVCGIGFSLAPAIRVTKADVTPALKEASTLQLPGYRGFGLRNLLMVVQVTGSLMLLMITGFLVMGLSQASSIQTKFDPHTMYLLSIDPVRDGYAPEKAQALFEKLPERLRTAGAAVRSVALAAQPPFSFEHRTTQLTEEDSHGASRVQKPVDEETVGAGYFAALSEPMLAGREFTELDQRTQARGSKTLPVVLNETAARGFFGNGDAIGGRLRGDEHSYGVVGVVRDLKNGLGVSRSVIYLPLTQRDFARPPAGGMTILVRSDAGTDALSRIRREITSIDPNLNIFYVRTLSDYLELSRSSERFAASAYAGIGVFGLVLSAIGLAGVTAYAVAQRRKEIGIRMALGARKGQVLALVLREGTALIGVGTVLGFLGAFAVAKALSAVTNVFVESLKIGTNDPRLLLGAPLLLAGLAMLACYLPARRAAKIDPLNALRQE